MDGAQPSGFGESFHFPVQINSKTHTHTHTDTKKKLKIKPLTTTNQPINNQQKTKTNKLNPDKLKPNHKTLLMTPKLKCVVAFFFSQYPNLNS